MKYYEFEYDIHTLFFGRIETVDESFSHEHGYEKRVSFEARDFRIIVWIGGMDHDVTSSIRESTPKLYNLYKEYFVESYMKQLECETRDGRSNGEAHNRIN